MILLSLSHSTITITIRDEHNIDDFKIVNVLRRIEKLPLSAISQFGDVYINQLNLSNMDDVSKTAEFIKVKLGVDDSDYSNLEFINFERYNLEINLEDCYITKLNTLTFNVLSDIFMIESMQINIYHSYIKQFFLVHQCQLSVVHSDIGLLEIGCSSGKLYANDSDIVCTMSSIFKDRDREANTDIYISSTHNKRTYTPSYWVDMYCSHFDAELVNSKMTFINPYYELYALFDGNYNLECKSPEINIVNLPSYYHYCKGLNQEYCSMISS